MGLDVTTEVAQSSFPPPPKILKICKMKYDLEYKTILFQSPPPENDTSFVKYQIDANICAMWNATNFFYLQIYDIKYVQIYL